MAGTRGRKPAPNKTAKELLDALKKLAAKESDIPQSAYVLLNEGWATVYNGVLAAGTKVDAGVNCYVNRKLLADALSNVGKKLTLTVMPTGELSVQSDDYHSVIPSADPAMVIPTPPDVNVFSIDDRVRLALVAASRVTRDTAEFVQQASVLFNGQTVVGTNNRCLIEAWHGLNLPVNTAVPKAFVTALEKYGDSFDGIGMGSETITIHFADGGFIRSQYYQGGWPEEVLTKYPSFFEGHGAVYSIPAGLFEAVRFVAPFGEPLPNGEIVLFRNESVQTHEDTEIGASKVVKGIFDEGNFNGSDLLLLEGIAHTMTISPTGAFICYDEKNTTRAVAGPVAKLPEAVTRMAAAAEQPPATPTPGTPDAAPPWGQGRAEHELAQMEQREDGDWTSPMTMPQEEPAPGPFEAEQPSGVTLGTVPNPGPAPW